MRTLRNEFEGFKFRMENREVHILMAYLCTFCWNVQNIVKIEGKVIFLGFSKISSTWTILEKNPHYHS